MGERLAKAGAVAQEAILRGLAQQESERLATGSQRPLGEIVFEITGSSRPEIGMIVAEAIGFPWCRPEKETVGEAARDLLPPRMALHYIAVPLAFDSDRRVLTLAMARPQDRTQRDEIEMLLGDSIRIEPRFSFPAYIKEAINKTYGVGAESIDRMTREISLAGEEDEDALAHGADNSEDAAIIRFVNQIIRDGYRLRATDIHFEPGEESFTIRYRLDGLLEEIKVPPALRRFRAAITSRIKVMAQLNIADQRLPQDGRIPFRVGHDKFDLRVSVLPTPLGEAINLRLLRRDTVTFGLADLGFEEESLEALVRASSNPNGMILITGPTGSGKTTTLYSLLQNVSKPTVKTITVEDPVEYRLPGIIQLQVHEEIGFTFARALRSILRHDPDVVLVGEIRDTETADIAVRMSMTGHLVFSTLHTNDAVATVARLLDMDQEPFILASTLTCVLAQRLVRLLCPECRRVHPVPEATQALLGPEHFGPGAAFSISEGCEACRHTGYRGRSVIYELLEVNDAIRRRIMERAPADDFRADLRARGIPSLRDNGVALARRGMTSLDEVLRVTQSVG
ncbi:MAG: GspE/PulE family protein [Sumerlaeia bacterium]